MREAVGTWQCAATADAAQMSDESPCVLITIGEAQYVVGLAAARELAAALVSALAQHGDETARQIGDQYLRRTDTCTCPVQVLMSQGCQCGGA